MLSCGYVLLLQVDAGMQHSSESQEPPVRVPLTRTKSSNEMDSNPTLVRLRKPVHQSGLLLPCTLI